MIKLQVVSQCLNDDTESTYLCKVLTVNPIEEHPGILPDRVLMINLFGRDCKLPELDSNEFIGIIIQVDDLVPSVLSAVGAIEVG